MAASPANPIFCDNIGNTTDALRCCYLSNQTSTVCNAVFGPGTKTFTGGCMGGDCISDCQQVSSLYRSDQQDNPYEGNGYGPIRRYLTCANVPNMAGYLSQSDGVLEPEISTPIAEYISVNTTNDALKSVAFAVTECLTATCRNARRKTECKRPCSAVNLLTNYTTPNVQGVNECLYSLCHGGYDSLPFADADVVGIGVFASYIMQCMFVVLLWFGLTGFELHNDRLSRKTRQKSNNSITETDSDQEKLNNKASTRPQSQTSPTPTPESHQSAFSTLLFEFHRAQCYFSLTLQLASLSYGIFSPDMLITFMLIPLATNGVLPIVFVFVLLFRTRNASFGITLLTISCWILSSLVYWILYSHVIPINSQIRDEKKKNEAYQQFLFKLSAIEACGGYSALAVCPKDFELGRSEIVAASHRLRVLTPVIWTFATVCLGVTTVGVVGEWVRGRRARRDGYRDANGDMRGDAGEGRRDTVASSGVESSEHAPFLKSQFARRTTYLLVTMCFLAGIGMQLSLLSIFTSLHMMNRKAWGFGQIVALTIWVPPLVGYLYNELQLLLKGRLGHGM